MKPFFVGGFLLTPMIVCSLSWRAEAQTAPKADPAAEKKQEAPQPKEKPDTDNPFPIKPVIERRNPQRRAQPGYGHDAMVNRRLAAFARLRTSFFEAVKMDAEKRKKLESMFNDYMAGLFNARFLPHTQPLPENMATPQEIPELKKQLEEAEKKGDNPEKVSSIKAKIYAANIVLEPCIIDEPVFFFNYVNKELNEEQRKAFDPVLRRWQMLRVAEVAPDNDFKQLRRATRDPELRGSNEELGKQLDAMIIDAMRTVKLGPERLDKEVMKKLAADTKPKIMEKLDPKQREHLEKTIAMLGRWDQEEAEVAGKVREELKDYRPANAQAQTGQTPAGGPNGAAQP